MTENEMMDQQTKMRDEAYANRFNAAPLQLEGSEWGYWQAFMTNRLAAQCQMEVAIEAADRFILAMRARGWQKRHTP